MKKKVGGSVTPIVFRVPNELLKEFKLICVYNSESQQDILLSLLKEYIKDHKLDVKKMN